MSSSLSAQASGDDFSDSNGLFTSIRVFRQFISRGPDGKLEASRITSIDCYSAWLQTRKILAGSPERAFRRALSAHITGVDGRTPFNQDEEEAVLRVVRQRERWECFMNSPYKFGEMGFRTKGFHEKALCGEVAANPPKKRAKQLPQTRDPLTSKPLQSKGGCQQESSEENSSGEEAYLSGNISSPDPDYDFMADAPPLDSSTIERLHPALSYEEGSGSSIPTNYEDLLMMFRYAIEKFKPRYGEGWWGQIHTMGRFILVSWGFVGDVSMPEAEALLQQVSDEHPGEYVMLYDHTSKRYEDKIVLQNPLAIEYFGGISRQHGGYGGKRFPPEETWKMFRTLVSAYVNKGQEATMVWRIRCFGKYQLCETTLQLDLQTKLLVERGRLVRTTTAG